MYTCSVKAVSVSGSNGKNAEYIKVRINITLSGLFTTKYLPNLHDIFHMLCFNTLSKWWGTDLSLMFRKTLRWCWNMSAHQRSLNRLAVAFVDSNKGSEGPSHSRLDTELHRLLLRYSILLSSVISLLHLQGAN